jgi:hypothetical protein
MNENIDITIECNSVRTYGGEVNRNFQKHHRTVQCKNEGRYIGILGINESGDRVWIRIEWRRAISL